MELIPFVCFVCLSVSIKLFSTAKNQDMLCIIGRKILCSRFIWYYKDRLDHYPYAIVQNIDSVEKCGRIKYSIYDLLN